MFSWTIALWGFFERLWPRSILLSFHEMILSWMLLSFLDKDRPSMRPDGFRLLLSTDLPESLLS